MHRGVAHLFSEMIRSGLLGGTRLAIARVSRILGNGSSEFSTHEAVCSDWKLRCRFGGLIVFHICVWKFGTSWLYSREMHIYAVQSIDPRLSRF